MTGVSLGFLRLATLLCLVVFLAAQSGCDRTATGLTDAAAEARTPDALTDIAIDMSDASDEFLDAQQDIVLDAGDDAADAMDATFDAADVSPDPFGECTVPRPDVPDAAPPCAPDSTSACGCSVGPSGMRRCLEDLTWSACQCPERNLDAGPIIDRVPPDVFEPIPAIVGPRLLAPQSGARVTTLRPTLRWRLPDGVTSARVELCADRPCDHLLVTRDIAGTSWRPRDALAHGVVFWRVRGLNADGAVTWTSATWEFGVPRRDTPVDTSYGVLKDFDGDGYDDLVAHSSYDRRGGGIRVFPGGPDGVSGDRVRILNPPDPPSWEPVRADTGGFGKIFAVGDLNGDGLADLVAGAPLYTELAGTFPPGGRAYLFFGSRSCVLAPSEVSYRPSEMGDPVELGHDVSVGDFNGDGYDDMLAASRSYGRYAGDIELFLGGPSGPDGTARDTSSSGAHTAQFVGDLNGDGYADIMARARNYQEPGLNDFALVVLYGNPEGHLGFHTQYIELPFRSALYDWIIRWGDVNEDGYADPIVSFDGFVYAFYGSSSGIRRFLRLNTPPDTGGGSGAPSFGIGLSMPVDVDGDGHAELLAGARVANDHDGQVYLFPYDGGDLGTMWTEEIPGRMGLRQGFSVPAIVGDLDGDGFNDVAVGAPLGDAPRLYVYSGGVGRWWETPRLMVTGLQAENVL